MNHPAEVIQPCVETARCPYCSRLATVELPGDYAPVYAFCRLCGKRFVVERLAESFQALKLEEALCFSDPDGREMEMGLGDEE